MRHKFNKPNGYPLPERTVLYSHKKHVEPIPQIGKKYHCFDDGKITFSRHYIIEVVDVLGHMSFKKKYPKEFEIWLEESKSCYWLYARSTDKFVIAKTIDEPDSPTQVFVRTKQGGWFSFSSSFLYCGDLDINGKIWDSLVANIDDFDFTQEDKERIIKEGTIE